MAFPPMVRPETRAVTPTEIQTLCTLSPLCSRATITALVAPETMPQMSPTTSLQTLDTRSAFRRRDNASLAPFSLWAAME